MKKTMATILMTTMLSIVIALTFVCDNAHIYELSVNG